MHFQMRKENVRGYLIITLLGIDGVCVDIFQNIPDDVWSEGSVNHSVNHIGNEYELFAMRKGALWFIKVRKVRQLSIPAYFSNEAYS